MLWHFARAFIFRGGVFLVLGALGLWIYQQPKGAHPVSEFLSEPDFDYFPEVEQLISEEDYGTALSLIAFIRSLDNVPNRDQVIETEKVARAELQSLSRKMEEAFLGAFTGKVDTPEAFGGALLADFCVVGDLRELVTQGKRKVMGEETDPLIAALSAFGVGATIAGFVPEPSTTAAGLTGQACLSMLKGMRKFGIMTDEFSDELIVLFRAAKESGDLEGFRGLYSNFKRLKTHAPPATMSSILRKVKSPEDLALVATAMERFPNETVTLFRVGGDDAMSFLRTLEETQPTQLRLILRKGPFKFQKAKLALRGSKAVRNGRMQQAKDFAAKWLLGHPKIRRLVLVFSSLSIGLGSWMLLRPFLKKKRNSEDPDSPVERASA